LTEPISAGSPHRPGAVTIIFCSWHSCAGAVDLCHKRRHLQGIRNAACLESKVLLHAAEIEAAWRAGLAM
jgi:hypothetical protein